MQCCSYLVGSVNYANLGNRWISSLTSKMGLTGITWVSGLMLGAAAARIMSHNFSKEYFQARQTRQLEMTVVALTGIAALAGKVYAVAMVPFLALGLGVILGINAQERCYRNSDQKICQFIQQAENHRPQYGYASGSTSDRSFCAGFSNGHIPIAGKLSLLSLQGYRGCLAYFNSVKLGQEISKKFEEGDLNILDLSETDLTDDDLQGLAQANVFEHVTRLILSGNHRLTGKGIANIAEARLQDLALKALDLRNTDLTDDDLLQLAQADRFHNVSRLILSDNPRLTGRGIAHIGKRGFIGLKSLCLGGNSQVVATDMDEWITMDGFQELETISLANTGITKIQLEQMIERSPWFKQLKGLNISWNDSLEEYPNNLVKLTELGEGWSQSVLLSGGPIYFHGRGIYSAQRGNPSSPLPVQTLLKAYKMLYRHGLRF